MELKARSGASGGAASPAGPAPSAPLQSLIKRNESLIEQIYLRPPPLPSFLEAVINVINI